MNSTKVKKRYDIHMDSKEATTYNNGTKLSSIYFQLERILYCTPNEHFMMAITDLQLPISFYLINDTNDTFDYYEYDNTHTVSLSHGNYTGVTLSKHLQSLLSGVTVSFSAVDYKLTFTTNHEFKILGSSTVLSIIGFTQEDHDFIQSNENEYTIKSPFPCNLTGTKNVYLGSDIPTISVHTKNSQYVNTLLKCALDVEYGDTYYYINFTGNMIRIENQNICGVTLSLRDDNNQYIDMNNVNWSLTMTIYIMENNELIDLQNTSSDVLGIIKKNK